MDRVLGKPKKLHPSVCFSRNGDFTWRVSDCEELVGVPRNEIENVANIYFLILHDIY
jgi:hypothetical protein